MEFVKLTEQEYRNFYNSYENSSFMQSIELGNLKKMYNQEVHLVGIKDEGKVVAASLLLSSKTIFNKKKNSEHFHILDIVCKALCGRWMFCQEILFSCEYSFFQDKPENNEGLRCFRKVRF